MQSETCTKEILHFGMFGGFAKFMFDILSGVLQRCPLSGSLFVMAIDPLLLIFKKISSAMLRVCADDVGAALRRLESITLAEVWFDKFRKASNLTLKPKTCVMILIGSTLDEANILKIR